MFNWIKDIISSLRKTLTKRKFDQFSIFKGQSRVEEFKHASETLKAIERFYYKGESLNPLINNLDCITVDEGWHIELHYLFPQKKARYPILYCYKDRKPDDNEWKKVEKRYTYDAIDVFTYKMKTNPMNIYQHIRVTPSEMGAWQVFLLELYPFIRNCIEKDHGDRETTLLITSYEDIIPIIDKYHTKIKEEVDLRPYVWMKKNKAYVTCCRWVKNSGLHRIIKKIEFDGNRVKDIIEIEGDGLYPCPVVYRR